MPKPKEARSLGAACFVELRTLEDLGRLTSAAERAPLPIFAFNSDLGVVHIAQADFFVDTAVFYFLRAVEKRHFPSYRKTAGVESVSLTNSSGDPTFIYSPIISLKQIPKAFISGLGRKDEVKTKIESLEVDEIARAASLAKLAAYRMKYDEPSLPFFTYPDRGRWVLGTFAKIDDYEEDPLFFYTFSDTIDGFIRYSINRPDKVLFTKNVDAPGHLYRKVIGIAGMHPLVD